MGQKRAFLQSPVSRAFASPRGFGFARAFARGFGFARGLGFASALVALRPVVKAYAAPASSPSSSGTAADASSVDPHIEASPTSGPVARSRGGKLANESSADRLRRLTEPGPYFDLFGTLMFGGGLRFNNPYRLTHVLGDSAESLSTTAPYVDMAVVVVTGRPTGLVHGMRFSWSVAMSGVPQGAFTPAYAAVLRPAPSWLLYGWAGAPFLTAPDFNVGAELGVASSYFVRAGMGLTAAIVGDAFYGAGTRERRAAFYPVVSGQLGVSINYEVLP